MNTQATRACAGHAGALAPPLNIVLTFDDAENKTVARQLLEKLFSKCADDLDVHYDEWSIEELDHAHCRNEALELAQHCDIFVVAATETSESFLDFVNAWLNSGSASNAALILIQSTVACPAAPEFARLKELAADVGMTCLSTTLPSPHHLTTRAKNAFLFTASTPPEISPIND